MAVFSRLQSFIFGGAVARGASDAVTPVLEPVRQHAWQKNKLRVLDPNTAARLVVQAAIDKPEAVEEASRNGYNANRLDALMYLAYSVPSIAEAFAMHRRGQIDDDQLHHVYAKESIEPQYWPHLDVLLAALLSPAEVANAVQQGHVPNDGILPVIGQAVPPAEGAVAPLTPDGHPPSHVPLTQIDLDPSTEAAGAGIGDKRLQVLANLAGLPPGAETVLAMWNRGLIDEETVDAGIREGHMKTKWGHAFKRLRWAVLSGQEYAEARLRDWISDEEMYAGGMLTGHTKSQMDLFYRNRGRPATPRQLWLGWARKVPAPDYPNDPANGRLTGFKDHELAIRRSNIRPEYARLLWDVRFNYPPLFQLNRLVQAGAIDADKAALWASYNLEAPDVIDALRRYWNTLDKGTADPHIARAQTQLWGTTHRSFIAGEIHADAATPALAAAGVAAGAIDDVLTLWREERALIRRQLTPAQIKKAYAKSAINEATGAAWTRDEALAALIERGYSTLDAGNYLEIP